MNLNMLHVPAMVERRQEDDHQSEKQVAASPSRLVRVLHGGKWQNFASGIAS